jgi:hypothetical protein
MKFFALILSLFVFLTTVNAQNPRSQTVGKVRYDTYVDKDGYDSVRIAVQDKADTVQKTFYYQSGRIRLDLWAKDSSHRFDALGRIEEKRFGLRIHVLLPDSGISYYANGNVHKTRTRKDSIEISKTFNKNGRLILSNYSKQLPHGLYTLTKDRNGQPIQAYQKDTIGFEDNQPIVREYDTVFHDNGRVFKINTSENDNSWGSKYYDRNGNLTKTTLPDSLHLSSFKDNVDCYYGLANAKGDTVIKARFDQIDTDYSDFIVGYTGSSAMLFDKNGAPIPLFSSTISSISTIRPELFYTPENYRSENEDLVNRKELTDTTATLYVFKDKDNYGVMTAKRDIVMLPQPLPLSGDSKYGDTFFGFDIRIGDSVIQLGYATRSGKAVFGDTYKMVLHTDYKDYFFLINKGHEFILSEGLTKPYYRSENAKTWLFKENIDNSKALGKGDETLILPPKFANIAHVDETGLFVATILRKDEKTKTAVLNDGIYDVNKRRWLLDTMNYAILSEFSNKTASFVVLHLPTKKQGIMDTTGKFILPLAYDSIGVLDYRKDLFVVKKGTQYAIFDVKNGKATLHKPKYDFLKPTHFDIYHNNNSENVYYFIVRRNNKWGVVDAEDKVIKPFEFDYASVNEDYNRGFYLVKNGQMTFYTLNSLPKNAPFPKFTDQVKSFPPVDNFLKPYFANDSGRVIIPPQYERVPNASTEDFTIVRDDQKRKKLIFYATGTVIDYPFRYQAKLGHPKSRLLFVKDSTENSFGVVTTDGKELLPCKNYGLALADPEANVFFVKRDTPLINRYDEDYFRTYAIDRDTLNESDNNWMMHDGNANLLNTKPFRFPINFVKGVGFGMQGTIFNLYRNDGTILTPFVKGDEREKMTKNDVYTEGSFVGFNNIHRNERTGFYTLFFNQGMSPTFILTKANGEIVVNRGRYDGISKFFGKYALVTASNKVGLIDTSGNEIIAPQDLRSYTGHLMDSLDLRNKEWQKISTYRSYSNTSQIDPQPFAFEDNYRDFHPDSLKITTAQKAALWNLLLDKRSKYLIGTASDSRIKRATLQATASFFNSSSSSCFGGDRKVARVTVAEKSIAFVLKGGEYCREGKTEFHNFYRNNGRWEALTINDLLNTQGDKRWLLNDLITQKVRALKGASIDCSNAQAFISQVENRFQLTETGIEFLFDEVGGWTNFVPIEFTWAELSPFLKIRL